MRNRLLNVTAALLLSSATVALAQADKKTTPPPAADPASSIDVGVRGTSVTGDYARFMRYQDLRTGANVNLDLNLSNGSRVFQVTGANVGYRDQSWNADYANAKLKLNAFFDGVPTNYGMKGLTSTPWTESAPGVWTLDASARQQVENKTAAGVLCAPGLAATATCNGLTATTVLGYPSVFRSLAKSYDIQSLRNSFGADLTYALAKDVDLGVRFQSSTKSGTQPFGMAFAFNEAYELPLSLDNRTNDFGVDVAWTGSGSLLRLAYERSQFKQHIASVTFDNAVRSTDYNDGQAVDMTGNGPWDPSGYSNGNTAARGRFAMPPSNTLDVFSATGMAKLPMHSSINASVAFSTSKQNDALIPWTINPVIANAATYAFYPGLGALPRSSTQAEMDGLNAVFNFNARPAPWASLALRYRYSDRKDRMPQFVSDSTVRFDSVPEQGIVAPAAYATEEWSSTRQTVSGDLTFTPVPFTALKLGFVNDTYEPTMRAFHSLADNTIRATFDTVGNQYLSFRAMIDRTRRTGSGFNEEAITEGGAQAQLRMFDDAERTRDRRTFLVTLSPVPQVDVTASYAFGKDVYDEEEQYFGLLNNKNTSANVGVTFTASPKFIVGVTYGQDKYTSFQVSRTANPFSGVAGAYESWVDANRDWNLSDTEKVNNVDFFVELPRALRNTDISFNYVMSDSNNQYLLGGPRIGALQNNSILTTGDTKPCATGLTSCFEQNPAVTNKWQRAVFNLTYDVSRRMAIGVNYWYEKLEISDFATINQPGTQTPRIDYFGSITTGYGNRPYKGNTVFGRVIVKF
jgi:hypothetical protein